MFHISNLGGLMVCLGGLSPPNPPRGDGTGATLVPDSTTYLLGGHLGTTQRRHQWAVTIYIRIIIQLPIAQQACLSKKHTLLWKVKLAAKMSVLSVTFCTNTVRYMGVLRNFPGRETSTFLLILFRLLTKQCFSCFSDAQLILAHIFCFDCVFCKCSYARFLVSGVPPNTEIERSLCFSLRTRNA